MRRRSFLIGAGGGGGAAAAGGVRVALDNPSGDVPPGDVPPGDGGSVSTRRYGQRVLQRRKADSNATNMLFICIDDCNDWLGFLNNHPGTHTPNLDELAKRSLVFTQAYCTVPLCNPARSSVLFGRAPYNSRVYDHGKDSSAQYHKLNTATSSLIDDVWAAGYETLGVGKIFHDGQARRWDKYRRIDHYLPGNVRNDSKLTRKFDPNWLSPYDGRPIGRGERFTGKMIDFGPSGVAPRDEPDGQIATWVQARLREDHDRPFFVGMGLHLPHDPLRLPKQFFDLHPIEDVVVPEFRPEDLNDLGPVARRFTDPFGQFELLRKSGLWEAEVQAYQAALSFSDYNVGRVLDELAHSRYADDTAIVVWSDQGYHLGEKLHIGKATLWERATRSPFLMHVPGRFDSATEFDRPVSMLDIGPTVAELCGAKIHARSDGRSLLPLLDDPDLADRRPPIMTWRPGNHSVRRGPWRYIRYGADEVELYDHRTDPNEYVNLAGRREFAAITSELDAFMPSHG